MEVCPLQILQGATSNISSAPPRSGRSDAMVLSFTPGYASTAACNDYSDYAYGVLMPKINYGPVFNDVMRGQL